MPSTTIARGNALSTFYIAPTLTPAAVLTLSSAAQTFNIPGLLTTDIVSVIGLKVAQVNPILNVIVKLAPALPDNVLLHTKSCPVIVDAVVGVTEIFIHVIPLVFIVIVDDADNVKVCPPVNDIVPLVYVIEVPK